MVMRYKDLDIKLPKIVSMSDWHLQTEAVFKYIGQNPQKWEALKEVLKTKGYKHYVSKSGSEYLYSYSTGYIYRYSDHWGPVASCNWTISEIRYDKDSYYYPLIFNKKEDEKFKRENFEDPDGFIEISEEEISEEEVYMGLYDFDYEGDDEEDYIEPYRIGVANINYFERRWTPKQKFL